MEQRHGVLDAERVQVEGGITFAAPRVEPDGDLVTDASGAARVGEQPLPCGSDPGILRAPVLSVMLASPVAAIVAVLVLVLVRGRGAAAVPVWLGAAAPGR